MRPRIYSSIKFGFSSEDIDREVLDVILRLNGAGYKAYIVGGGVRDLLLGKRPKDFDLVTDARPTQIKRIFRNARVIGRRFKLVHIYFSRLKYLELATFRQKQSDPDDPSEEQYDQNEFGTEETDAFRRDLTINGLYYDPESEEIIDYVGGVEDLQAGLVKVIGEPALRFAEDPVRMLRVIRHAVKASFSIDPLTLSALQQSAELIKNSATVRVYEELRKDLNSGTAFTVLKLLNQYGLLQFVAPELAKAAFLQKDYDGSMRKILKRCDEIVWLEPSERAATSVEALIALAFRYSKKANFLSSFSKATKDELPKLLQRCFTGLAIPKKEMFKLADLLDLLRAAATPNLTTRQIKSISRDPLAKELHLLLCFLNQDSSTQHLLDLLEMPANS